MDLMPGVSSEQGATEAEKEKGAQNHDCADVQTVRNSALVEINLITSNRKRQLTEIVTVMSEWQQCPVCEGTGYVAYAYGTAAGQTWDSTDCSNKQCHRCSGSGTIMRPAPVEDKQ